jgi:peroxiredoxin
MKLIAALLSCTLTLLAADDFSNRRAPGFSLPDSHFQQHDPQDYRGKVLIIEFMQTGCAICQKLTDNLVQLQTKYGDKLAIISIMTLPDNYDTADKFAAAHKVTWPMVFDSGQVMASYLKMTPVNPRVEFPHMFVIDGNGTIRHDAGSREESELTPDSISAQIDKLLK